MEKVIASLCHLCLICRFGGRNPDSLVGRVFAHPFHADPCPFWKAEQGEIRRRANSVVSQKLIDWVLFGFGDFFVSITLEQGC
jgi:hypothetical protein